MPEAVRAENSSAEDKSALAAASSMLLKYNNTKINEACGHQKDQLSLADNENKSLQSKIKKSESHLSKNSMIMSETNEVLGTIVSAHDELQARITTERIDRKGSKLIEADNNKLKNQMKEITKCTAPVENEHGMLGKQKETVEQKAVKLQVEATNHNNVIKALSNNIQVINCDNDMKLPRKDRTMEWLTHQHEEKKKKI